MILFRNQIFTPSVVSPIRNGPITVRVPQINGIVARNVCIEIFEHSIL